MNISDLSDTIVAKSDQLNSDDLVVDKLITVTGVSRGNNENPVIINYQGDDGRPFKPCKTVRRILIAAWGEDGSGWIGKQALLFNDKTVLWAGKEHGGVRIRALSGIMKPLNVKLSYTRGKKKDYRIEVLEPQQKSAWPQDAFNKQFEKMGEAVKTGAMTPEQMITKFQSKGDLSESQREQIRALGDVKPDIDNLMDDGE